MSYYQVQTFSYEYLPAFAADADEQFTKAL